MQRLWGIKEKARTNCADVAPDGIREIAVERTRAMDSWFQGYYWDVAVCESCDVLTHLGWKFVNLADESKY
jgi:hypothetical protein